MELLLRLVEIFDPRNPEHGKQKHVLLKEGKVVSITDEEPQTSGRVVDCQGKKLSPGWFDMKALFGEPGHEYKEDLFSGRRAAAAGGFTEVALWPNTDPVIQTKNDLRYILSDNPSSLTQLYPIAAITRETKGKDLTEMIDLHTGGAVAFSDGIVPLWNTDIVVKTLQYLQKFDGLLITQPEDTLLTQSGSMNEGINSTMLGMKGIPKLAEELVVARDLKLLEYAGGKIHFSNISTAESVKLIREAKKQGLKVSCDVAAHQLVFEDDRLQTFDTNYKVNPPLREQTDTQALLEGLKDGTIDVIVSSHIPQDQESKKLEFDLAEFGMIGLQTVLPILTELSDKIGWDVLFEKIVVKPRELLNIAIPEVKVGADANLTLFDPKQEWVFDSSTNFSKSNNSPYFGKKLKGAVNGVFYKEHFWMP